MTVTSLTVAALLALASGQSAADREAYRNYQVQLARVLAAESAPVPASPAATSAAGGCMLVPGGGTSATTRDCTSCHAGFEGTHSHPVDVDYESARYRSFRGSGPSLRPAAEVVRRGVFLADGKLTCLTCHDGNSTFKAKLALPPDAPLAPPVKPGDPSTYDPSLVRPSPLKGLVASTGRQLLPPGTPVSPTPLCKACHSFD